MWKKSKSMVVGTDICPFECFPVPEINKAAMALFNMVPLTWSLGQTHKGAMTWNEALASSLCLLGMIFLVLQHKAAPQAQVRMIL